MAATSGRKAKGRRIARVMSAVDGRFHGRNMEPNDGVGSGSTSAGRMRRRMAPPLRDVGTPYSEAARSVAGTPTRSAAPVTEPAEVPTMTVD